MSEITLKAIEQLLDKKFTEELKPIRADISGLKTDIFRVKTDVAGIRTGVALLATSEELGAVSTRLTTIEGILNNHTTTLDAIVKDTSNWNTEMVVMRERMKRYEDALKLVGQKLNLDLQALLH